MSSSDSSDSSFFSSFLASEMKKKKKKNFFLISDLASTYMSGVDVEFNAHQDVTQWAIGS